MQDNPSLKAYLEEALGIASANGRDLAMAATDLPVATFPADCPYAIADILADRFYPGEPSALLEAEESLG